jgi:iron complex outermembrane receptor protein
VLGTGISRPTLALVLVAVAADSATAPAQERMSASDEAAPLETVLVTGTLIKRADYETPSPMQVLTAEDLQQSGHTSVSEVLRNLAANGQGTFSQSNYIYTGSASGVALRGLTVGATLILIDGERMVPYPLSDDGQRNFVDVSSIPFAVVERIDVLKDGASAEYGSDAIAGVINVILKKSFAGLQTTVEGGTTSRGDGTTWHLSLIGGSGDLAADDYNGYFAVEYRHQDNILSINRSGVWNTLDWTPYGGYNNSWGAGNTNPAGQAYSAPLGGYLVNPAVDALDPTAVFLEHCNYNAFFANHCTYVPPRFELQPQTGNLNLLGRYTRNLGGGWRVMLTGSLFRSEAEQIGGGYFGINTAPYQNVAYAPGIAAPTLVPPEGILLTVPATYPGNTFRQPTQIVVPTTELGQIQTQFVTNTWRLFAGLTGTAVGWDFDLTGGLMYAALKQQATGLVNGEALQNALNNGYVFGSANGPSLFAPVAEATDTNALQVIDLRAVRALTQLRGGPLSLALGTGFYHLAKNAPAPPAVASGEQTGFNLFAIGTETNTSAYVEIAAPLLRGLEIDGAVRWDHFPGFGSAINPKFGLTYSPFRLLTVRGTYGKGFRAPNPNEAGVTGTVGLSGYPATDPVLCPSRTGTRVGDFPSQCLIFPSGVAVAGKNLQPERSTNYTFGLIVKPTESVAFSVDYWDIRVNEDIQSGVSALFLGDDPSLFPLGRGAVQVLPEVTSIGPGGPVLTPRPTPVGPYAYQLFPYVNFSETHVNGVDVDLAAHINLRGAGRLNGSLYYTRLIHHLFGFAPNLVDLAGTHGPSIISGDTGNPKNRATASLGWDRGGANITLSANYVGSFNITDPSNGTTTCATALNGIYYRFPIGSSPIGLGNWCNVSHFTSVDLYGQYAFAKHLTVHGAVLNLLGEPPPLDIQTTGAQNAAAYNPAMHQAGAVGRFFNIGCTYTF